MSKPRTEVRYENVSESTKQVFDDVLDIYNYIKGIRNSYKGSNVKFNYILITAPVVQCEERIETHLHASTAIDNSVSMELMTEQIATLAEDNKMFALSLMESISKIAEKYTDQ